MSEKVKFPIYRRSKNGKEYYKVNSVNECVSILIDNNHSRILNVTNSYWKVACAIDDEETVSITRDEYEKVYGETMWKLTKANQLQ